MERQAGTSETVAELNLEGCALGPVLQPLEPESEATRACLEGWETPLAPRGGFVLDSGLAVVRDGAQSVLEWGMPEAERAIVTGDNLWRDYSVVASVRPLDGGAQPHDDRRVCSEALVGIVFRVVTSRSYYQFGIEGRRRAVLYRRRDDEWFVLGEKEVSLPDGYVTLGVELDGDGIRCSAEGLGVRFFCTDSTLGAGKTGVRAIGRCRLAHVKVTLTSAQKERALRRRRLAEAEEQARSEELADAVLVRTLDLGELGGRPLFSDFACPGRYDMLIGGRHLRALSAEGQVLWELPEAIDGIVFSREHTPQGRLLYGLSGTRKADTIQGVTGGAIQTRVAEEMCVIRGGDGQVLSRRKVPRMGQEVYLTAFTTTTGNLSGQGPFDIVLREWRRGAGGSGTKLWAYNKDLELLWKGQVDTPYGHAYALEFCDVDGDGRDEMLAGGTLFTPDGKVGWVHDLSSEMDEIPGAHHYDAVALGRLAEDPSVDPVGLLLGGSAGVYVVDGLTGRTRMVHRIGHAQGRTLGRVRDDMPGTQVLVACRWGNMGIVTLFSGYGDRLWSIQPDYIGQGATPVTWGGAQTQLIWVNTSRQAMGLYDGYGRRAKRLGALERVYGNRMRREVEPAVARLGSDPHDLLCLTVENEMLMFGSSP